MVGARIVEAVGSPETDTAVGRHVTGRETRVPGRLLRVGRTTSTESAEERASDQRPSDRRLRCQSLVKREARNWAKVSSRAHLVDGEREKGERRRDRPRKKKEREGEGESSTWKESRRRFRWTSTIDAVGRCRCRSLIAFITPYRGAGQFTRSESVLAQCPRRVHARPWVSGATSSPVCLPNFRQRAVEQGQ